MKFHNCYHAILRFDSTGLLADSENAPIIGTYEYVPDKIGYKCEENGLYLSYYPSRGVSIFVTFDVK